MLNFSSIEENYIKSIYSLQGKTDMVTTNALSGILKTSPASVTDMLKKLKAKKILEYKKYHGFRLNDTGKREALKIIRRHRLWEFFLVKKLGMDWNNVHAIAEELEHVSSPELITRLDKFLGEPTTDPHGDPIPNEKGEMPKLSQVLLSDYPLRKCGIVSSVGNQSEDMLKMLSHYGISIGAQIKVLKQFDFDGSLEIEIQKQEAFNISKQVAQNIFVYND
ncbi:metal-dependent transcriptional regulator [soil metagenome]